MFTLQVSFPLTPPAGKRMTFHGDTGQTPIFLFFHDRQRVLEDRTGRRIIPARRGRARKSSSVNLEPALSM